MFLFAKKYDKSIRLDLLRKENCQKLCCKKGNGLILSFPAEKSQQREKMKKFLALECLSLKKSFFKFEAFSEKGKRKQNFHLTQIRAFLPLSSLKSIYFLYNFNKNAVSLNKNLNEVKNNKNIEASNFDYLAKNFNELNFININFVSFKSIQLLSFYRLFL